MAAWTARAGLPFGRGGPRLLDDPSRLELLGPELLRAEAANAGLLAARGSAADRAALLLDHARLLREHGERAGAPGSLARAARQAEAAAARGRSTDGALEAARASLAAAELAGDGALLESAAARLDAALPCADPVQQARHAAAAAALALRRALHDERPDYAAHGAACDAAVDRWARLVRRRRDLLPELAAARADRAELLVAVALRLRDAAPAARAAADLAELAAALDGARLPVLAGRVARLRAEALTVEGELTGCARRLGEASRLLTDALAELPADHAPVERARLGRALGHAARALADAVEDEAAADTLLEAAVFAFATARAGLAGSDAGALAAQLAFERTAALAARALRRQDPARAREAGRIAEAALRAELLRLDGRREPAAWAAVQVALARLYAAEPGGGRRGEAALALEAALEVFGEAGLRSLAAEAAEALRALRSA